MGFVGTNLELKPEVLKPDSTQRQLYKNMMNSIIGKFSQRQCFTNTRFVQSSEEIDDLLDAGKETITDFHTISNDICELQTTPRTCQKMENRKGNPILTAFVTSLSRIDMHKNIMFLKKKQFRVLYTDTDSLIFCGKKGNPIPFDLNCGVGSFKHEFREKLTGFCCIAKKSYVVTTTRETETKVCGLSFSSTQAKNSISFDAFEKFLNDKIPLQAVPQTRTRKSSVPFSVQKRVTYIKPPTSLKYSRVLQTQPDRMFTVPYGFTEPKKSK